MKGFLRIMWLIDGLLCNTILFCITGSHSRMVRCIRTHNSLAFVLLTNDLAILASCKLSGSVSYHSDGGWVIGTTWPSQDYKLCLHYCTCHLGMTGMMTCSIHFNHKNSFALFCLLYLTVLCYITDLGLR